MTDTPDLTERLAEAAAALARARQAAKPEHDLLARIRAKVLGTPEPAA
jgi:hypothetical protein